MIWLAWRQFRTQCLIALGALVVLAVILLVTGLHLSHLYDSNVAPCAAHGNCDAATAAYFKNYGPLQTILDQLVLIVPLLIGMFWGAPLVARELETGTYQLAWTQSVTRSRWLAVKLGVIGLASMIVTGLLGLMVTWWFSRLDQLQADQYGTFDQRVIVPIAYAAFAFALGATIGVLIRRTLPAMAVTLVAFIAARIVVASVVRPHLIAAAHRSYSLVFGPIGYGSTNSGPFTLLPSAPTIPNAWIYSAKIVDAGGHGITPKQVETMCPTLPQGGRIAGAGIPKGVAVRAPVPGDVQSALQSCIAKVGTRFHEVVTYQPAGRYWQFQWYETAIFAAAALVLAGVCFWWTRHRLT